jgi:hypothetical protein
MGFKVLRLILVALLSLALLIFGAVASANVTSGLSPPLDIAEQGIAGHTFSTVVANATGSPTVGLGFANLITTTDGRLVAFAAIKATSGGYERSIAAITPAAAAMNFDRFDMGFTGTITVAMYDPGGPTTLFGNGTMWTAMRTGVGLAGAWTPRIDVAAFGINFTNELRTANLDGAFGFDNIEAIATHIPDVHVAAASA